MRKLVPFLIPCLFLAIASPTPAQSTEQMVSYCKGVADAALVGENGVSFDQDFDSGMCWGAFASIQATITLADAKTDKPYLSVCASPKSTRTQLVQIFLVYAKAHPERYQDDYFLVALAALRKAFPCPAG